MVPNKEFERGSFVYYTSGRILKPLDIFTYWCARKKGEVPPPEEIRVVPTGLGGFPVQTPNYMVPPSYVGNGRKELALRTLGIQPSYALERLVNYLGHCLPDQKYYPLTTLNVIKASPFLYGMLAITGLRLWSEPRLALMAGVQILDRIIDNKIDAFRAGELSGDYRRVEEELYDVADTAASEIEAKMIRVLKTPDSGIGDEVVVHTRGGDVRVARKIGRLSILEGEKVSMAVIGPANVGKSTAVANLEHASRVLIENITNVTELWSLAIPCHAVDFDVRTPDIDKIRNGGFQGFLTDKKVDWTTELALQTVDKFLTADSGVYFVSTPGGRPDQITDTLSLPLDSAILLLRAGDQTEWESVSSEWADVLKKNGVTPLALVRSRKQGETSRLGAPAENSALTNISWKQRGGFEKQEWLGHVRGRLVGASRKIVSDEFYVDLAKLLLLDLLPGLVIDRYQRALNYTSLTFQDRSRFDD